MVGRFVRHQRAHPLRIAGREVEPDLGAAAGSEHIGRPAAERLDQRRGVVGLNIELQFLGRAVEGAARVAARVVGDDRVAVGEVSRNIGEDAGILRAAGDDQQHRAGPLHLIVDPGAGTFSVDDLVGWVMTMSPVDSRCGRDSPAAFGVD